MLQGIKKKKPKKIIVDDTQEVSVVCGACSHQRQPSDTAPEWQCPGCGAAYVKVNPQLCGDDSETNKLSQQELRKKNLSYLNQRKKESTRTQSDTEETLITTGLSIGALTFIKGLGKAASACVKVAVPASPVVQAIGVMIIVGTLIYAAIRFLG